MTPESRYSSADSLFVASHSYTELGVLDIDSTSGSAVVNSRQALYRSPTLPVDPIPTSTRANVTSFMHLYAQDRFGDAEKWWIIADANPQIRYPLDLKINSLVYLP